MRSTIRLLVSLVAIVATALPASAVTIDFESLGIDEVVDSQFAGDQILFGNAVTLVAGISLNEIDFPPTSGTHVISGLGSGVLGVTFLLPAQLVSFQLTTADTALVQYFDALSVPLGQSLVDPNLGGNTQIAFDAASPLISSVSIGSLATGNAFFLTVDDFSFERTASAAIPEPSGFLLMACGLVVVRSAIRRRA